MQRIKVQELLYDANRLMKMEEKISINGQSDVPKALTAAESLKKEIEDVLPELPDNWRDLMKAYNPYYKTDKGNSRLSNLRNGRTAPTLEEVKQLKLIAGI